MGNYMLQDRKVFSSERSKAAPVPQHFARKCHLTKTWGEDGAESPKECFRTHELLQPAVDLMLQGKTDKNDDQMNMQNIYG